MKTHTLTIEIASPGIADPRGTMVMSLDGEEIAYQEFTDMLYDEDLAACYAIRIQKKGGPPHGPNQYKWYKMDAFSFIFNNRTFRAVIAEATE